MGGLGKTHTLGVGVSGTHSLSDLSGIPQVQAIIPTNGKRNRDVVGLSGFGMQYIPHWGTRLGHIY